jgi:hypothetical protein
MKNVLNGFDMLLRGLAVVLGLLAGGVVLLIASLFEKLQGLGR